MTPFGQAGGAREGQSDAAQFGVLFFGSCEFKPGFFDFERYLMDMVCRRVGNKGRERHGGV